MLRTAKARVAALIVGLWAATWVVYQFHEPGQPGVAALIAGFIGWVAATVTLATGFSWSFEWIDGGE